MYHAPVPVDSDVQETHLPDGGADQVGFDLGNERLREAHLHNGQVEARALFAPFFGVSAATVSALPRLAKLTHAQIIPVVTRQLSWGRGYAVRFYPPWDNYPSGDLEADVARMNTFIEERIREMPAQYLWLHRRFKTRPVGEPSLYE